MMATHTESPTADSDRGRPDPQPLEQHGLYAHTHGAGAPISTRGERPTSYDVGDFAVPVGREEDWRFTPLDLLHGLHDGSAVVSGAIRVEIDPAPEVTVETVGRQDVRIGRAGIPGDRVAAQAWSAFSQATVLTVPAQAVSSRPTVVTLHGDGATAYGHLMVDVKQSWPYSSSSRALNSRIVQSISTARRPASGQATAMVRLSVSNAS